VNLPAPEPWCAPALVPRNGVLRVPEGPGLGVTFDPAFLATAERLEGP
jgi:L-alanine-DL-glutamate epimerase-like enolase superfamily enzyme